MKITHLVALALCAFTAAPLVAQSTAVFPLGQRVPGNSNNAFPWNRARQNHRYQQIYSNSNFKGITTPIFIKRIRFRARPGTWTGGTYTNTRISMSTCATSTATMSTTFAANHGQDLKQVYPSGTVWPTA